MIHSQKTFHTSSFFTCLHHTES